MMCDINYTSQLFWNINNITCAIYHSVTICHNTNDTNSTLVLQVIIKACGNNLLWVLLNNKSPYIIMSSCEMITEHHLWLSLRKSVISTHNTPICFILHMYLLFWISYNNYVSFSKLSSDWCISGKNFRWISCSEKKLLNFKLWKCGQNLRVDKTSFLRPNHTFNIAQL